MNKQAKDLISAVKECARSIQLELGAGWPEEIYQRAMEVSLRQKGITYESQRIVTITFNNHFVGESKPDLVVWANKNGKRSALVIDLKVDSGIKGDHRAQVERYVKELKKQLRSNESVLPFGLVINFAKESSHSLKQDEYEEVEKVQILKVKN